MICVICVIRVIRVMPVGPGPRIGVLGRLCWIPAPRVGGIPVAPAVAGTGQAPCRGTGQAPYRGTGQALRGNDPRLHGDRLPTSRHWLGVVDGGWGVESEDAVLVEVEAVVEEVQVSHASGGGEDLLFGPT